MDSGKGIDSPTFERYERCCQLVKAIKEKLNREDLSEGKRGALEFQLRDLENRILPGLRRTILFCS